jgi:hypothetical protein
VTLLMPKRVLSGLSKYEVGLTMFRFIALPVTAVALALALVGCTESTTPAPPRTPPESATMPASAGPLIDPLSELTDPKDERFESSTLIPVVHEHGTGPGHYSIARPAEPTAQVRFYISCTPDSMFTLTMTKSFSGPCSTTFQNTGMIPLPPDIQTLGIDLDIPNGVQYWLVGIPVNN